MKKRWMSLLIALLYALSLLNVAIAETGVDIDVAIDAEEIDIFTEPDSLDVSEEDVIDIPLVEFLDDIDLPDNGLDTDASMQVDLQTTPNRVADGDYDHEAFEIDENNVLVKYTGNNEAVVIPDGVTGIGDEAFNNHSEITSVAIPEGVTSIGSSAFASCGNLADITIPDSVTSVGSNAFYGCYAIRHANLGSNGAKALSRANYTFRSQPEEFDLIYLYDGDTSTGLEIVDVDEDICSVTIPDYITSIGDYAFSNCTDLYEITIPSSVNNIGRYAFRGCTDLSHVTVLAQEITIDPFAFFYADSRLDYYIVCNSNAVNKLPSNLTTLIHTEVVDPYVEPTYTEAGKTEGSHCSTCGMVFTAQEDIPAIELTKSSISLTVGQSDQLTINSLFNRKVTWSSSNEAIASVKDGKVTAIKEGTCSINATFNDGHVLRETPHNTQVYGSEYKST